MQKFKPTEKLTCPYCDKRSAYSSDSYVKPASYAATQEMCEHCDEIFLIRRRQDGAILVDSNWTERIYSEEFEKI